jgi:superfamily I DNA/RNA helicase
MGSWMVDITRLDDDQKDFVENKIDQPGNIWIQGMAGSGKSVMLVHAIRRKKEVEPHASMCLVVYTRALVDLFKTGLSDTNITGVPVFTFYQFQKSGTNYDYIFCDEVQDLTGEQLSLINSRAGQVYSAGDKNQSIYDHGVAPSQIQSLLNAKTFELNTVHRLTRSIMSAVTKMMPNLNLFGAKRDMTKQDVQIRVCSGESEAQEVAFVWEKASNEASNGYTAAILLPRHDDIHKFTTQLATHLGEKPWMKTLNTWGKTDYHAFNAHMNNQGIKVEYVGNGAGGLASVSRSNKVIIMTYHSAKGMDFDGVYLPFLSSGTSISSSTLFMVAMTRSRRNLFITYSGSLHSHVSAFVTDSQQIKIGQEAVLPDDDDFDF